MNSSHLTLRLSSQDAELIEQLRVRSGLSKSDIVKSALRAWLATQPAAAPAAAGLFALGDGRFGKHGHAARQTANLKAVVRSQLKTKRRT